jgi:hypothetical protein
MNETVAKPPVKGVQPVNITIYKDPLKSPYIIPSPTGNCQMFGVSYMNSILAAANPKQELITLMGENRKHTSSKRLLMCDIKQALIDKFTEIFGKKAIVGELPYTSTNNSEMCIVLLDVGKVSW